MKRTIALFLLFLVSQPAFAKRIIPLPQVPQYKYSVKLYNTFTYSETRNSMFLTNNEVERIDFLHPSVAFNWKTRKGNFREIELNSFQLGKVTESQYAANTLGMQTYIESKATNISIRYEYILHLAKRKQWKLNPMLGFAANPYYIRQQTLISFPSSMVGGQTTDSHIGVRCYVVPRLNYDVSRRLFLDFNIPVCIADLNANSIESNNGTSMSSASTADFVAVPNLFSARLGIGLRL